MQSAPIHMGALHIAVRGPVGTPGTHARAVHACHKGLTPSNGLDEAPCRCDLSLASAKLDQANFSRIGAGGGLQVPSISLPLLRSLF